MRAHYALTRTEYERELDETLAGSFPASDPLPWTLGASSWMDVGSAVVAAPVPDAIDVVFTDGRRFGGIRLAILAEAMLLVAAVPIAILIVGVPVIAVLRGMASVLAWLTGYG